MMSLMDSVLCDAATTPGAVVVRATSSAPPWADVNLLQRGDSMVSAMVSSPDGAQSDAASSSSYVISSSGLIDPSSNCRGMISGNLIESCGDMETRDSSPQSTSFDGYDHPHLLTHQQLMMKKSHGNKPHRDPTSHRIIEKRRRDRMNNCLTNLSKLIPSAYLKKGRGRIEKTEIIEMAIRYMKHIELERRQQKREHMELQEEIMLDKNVGTDEDDGHVPNGTVTQPTISNSQGQPPPQQSPTRSFGEHYRQGFFDCIAETLRFLAGAEGLTVNDQMKTRLLYHLREYFGRLADCESQEQNPNSIHPITVSSNHERPEESDEPLNMSIKRPRTSTTASRYPLTQQSSNAEMPSSSSISSGGCNEIRHHGSQLRDILETKQPFSLTQTPMSKHGTKVEPSAASSQQAPVVHLPHSSMPSMFMQQKFSNATNQQVLEQKHNTCGGQPLGSTVADCNSRSISGLLTSVGSRSTSSSNATTTSQYPSSPGSSVNSFVMESPPGLHSHSPPLSMSGNGGGGFLVPIFALHPVGLFYVPLTVSSHVLDASFNASVLICGEGGAAAAASANPLVQQMTATALSSVTHPVTINVNFNFLPNMANILPNLQPNPGRLQARIGGGCSSSCGSSSLGSAQSGVILNTAAYASNLRLALKH